MEEKNTNEYKELSNNDKNKVVGTRRVVFSFNPPLPDKDSVRKTEYKVTSVKSTGERRCSGCSRNKKRV